MSILFGTTFGDPFFGTLALCAAGLLLLLTARLIRGSVKRRREQRHRQKERREFWGYE